MSEKCSGEIALLEKAVSLFLTEFNLLQKG